MNNVINRKTCRICGGKLTKILSFGNMYLQGLFVKEGYPNPPKRKVPLELMWCDTNENENGCGLVQLSKTVSQNILYSTYWYRSATNESMRNHLKDIVDTVVKYIDDDVQRTVLDIGANDCTLLSFYPNTYKKFGVDPSNSMDDSKDESIVKIKDVFPTNKLGTTKFDAITSIAMLYDLEDPVTFVKNVYSYLKENGLWVFEMSYLPSMIENNSFDTICNEHIEYYSISVIETLLDKCGMKLVDATLNDTNGGSVQCVAVKKTCNCFTINNENLNKLRILEFEQEYDNITPYNKFKDNVTKAINEIRQFVIQLKLDKKTIHLLGASTKGNTLLQACGIDNTIIPYASDRNPDKWGGYTLGTNIKIISEEESRAMKPDYFLVLPWHFKDSIIRRERDTILSGTGLIFPLPKLEIINKDNI
jgi:hypothetical protein